MPIMGCDYNSVLGKLHHRECTKSIFVKSRFCHHTFEGHPVAFYLVGGWSWRKEGRQSILDKRARLRRKTRHKKPASWKKGKYAKDVPQHHTPFPSLSLKKVEKEEEKDINLRGRKEKGELVGGGGPLVGQIG